MKISQGRVIARNLAMLAVGGITILAFGAQASAATFSPDFTCTSGYDCFFSRANESGTHVEYKASTVKNAWYTLPSKVRTANSTATNKSKYNLWTVNFATDQWRCTWAGKRGATVGAGYFYINGSGGCQVCTPPIKVNGKKEYCPVPM
jgi:hypothetical protein